jgi:hypothetical protein
LTSGLNVYWTFPAQIEPQNTSWSYGHSIAGHAVDIDDKQYKMLVKREWRIRICVKLRGVKLSHNQVIYDLNIYLNCARARLLIQAVA